MSADDQFAESFRLVARFQLQRELEYKQYLDSRDKNEGADQRASKWIVATGEFRKNNVVHLICQMARYCWINPVAAYAAHNHNDTLSLFHLIKLSKQVIWDYF